MQALGKALDACEPQRSKEAGGAAAGEEAVASLQAVLAGLRKGAQPPAPVPEGACTARLCSAGVSPQGATLQPPPFAATHAASDSGAPPYCLTHHSAPHSVGEAPPAVDASVEAGPPLDGVIASLQAQLAHTSSAIEAGKVAAANAQAGLDLEGKVLKAIQQARAGGPSRGACCHEGESWAGEAGYGLRTACQKSAYPW